MNDPACVHISTDHLPGVSSPRKKKQRQRRVRPNNLTSISGKTPRSRSPFLTFGQLNQSFPRSLLLLHFPPFRHVLLPLRPPLPYSNVLHTLHPSLSLHPLSDFSLSVTRALFSSFLGKRFPSPRLNVCKLFPVGRHRVLLRPAGNHLQLWLGLRTPTQADLPVNEPVE